MTHEPPTPTLSFPVMCVAGDLIRIRKTWEDLTTTTTAGIGNRMFENLRVIDCEGRESVVDHVRVLHGVGFFWGYNVFLNRRVRVDLVFKGASGRVSLADVKAHVLRSFARWHGWQSRGDFVALKARVEKAQSIREITELLEG